MRRRLLGLLPWAFAIAACGAPQAFPPQGGAPTVASASEPASEAMPSAAAETAHGSASEGASEETPDASSKPPSETAPEPTSEATAETASISAEDAAEIRAVIRRYADLMTGKDYASLVSVFTGRMKSEFNPGNLSGVGIEAVTVSSLRFERVNGREVVVDVVLDVQLASESHTAFDEGVNERWFHMVKDADGHWRIAEMDSSPF